MKVFILDILLNQASEKRIPYESLLKLNEELKILSKLENDNDNIKLVAYLKHKKGIKFEGDTDIPLYKFRLTDGDRVLYTYGKYLPYFKNIEDSIVLLEYSKHDDQARLAVDNSYRRTQHNYYHIKQVISGLELVEGESVSEETLYQVASIILSECPKGIVVSDDELKDLSPDEIDKYVVLSTEQNKIIEEFSAKVRPTLIMGGAGTGKTLIAIRLLESFNVSNENCSAIYFTQSKELLNKVQKQYNTISSRKDSVNKIEFANINEFCLDILKLNRTNFIQTRDFLEYYNTKCTKKDIAEKNGISDIAVWTEIRGIIKGSMGCGKEWRRNAPIPQEIYPKSIEVLEKKGYLKRSQYNKKTVELVDSIDNVIAKMHQDYTLDEKEKNDLNEIINYFSSFDANIVCINRDEYMSSSDEISILDKKQREIAYDISLEYNKYLKDNDLYDENDIVRYMFENKLPLYDLTIVDEVQDYTELQIYLIYSMCKHKNNIVYAGDIHQIINPTVFDVGRLKNLHYDVEGALPLNICFLRNNYRCQQGIVDVANTISEFRRNTIGRKIEEMEQPEYASDMIIYSMPSRLEYSEKNIKDVMEEIMKYPQVAVLVPDVKTKDNLIEIIGKEKYEEYDIPFVFTTNEIKGMEYAYIFCFNMIGNYNDIWKDLEHKRKTKETKYRFCFNSIYVAATRAQHHLCFMDSIVPNVIDQKLNLRSIDTFDKDELNFDTLSTSLEVWYRQASLLKNNGDYLRALKYYKMAGEYVRDTDIFECEAAVAEENKDYNTATKFCLLMGDFRRAEKNSREKDVADDLKLLSAFFSGNNHSVKNITQYIERTFNSTESHKLKIYQMAAKKADEFMWENMLNIDFPEL